MSIPTPSIGTLGLESTIGEEPMGRDVGTPAAAVLFTNGDVLELRLAGGVDDSLESG